MAERKGNVVCLAKTHNSTYAYVQFRCRCPETLRLRRDQQREYRARHNLPKGERALVDATATHRRIRAMMALGHTGPELAGMLRRSEDDVSSSRPGDGLRSSPQWSREHVHEVLKRPRVTRGTQARFEALYDTVHMLPGASQRLRLLGEARGWVVPLAWDDITDLDETPQGVRAQSKEQSTRVLNKARELMYEYQCIRDSGIGHEYALKELGVVESAWYAAMQRSKGIEKRKSA